MKPILFAGAALMIGASIYGFVDYKKSGESNLKEMYVKEAVLPAATSEEKLALEPVTPVKSIEKMNLKKAEPARAKKKTAVANEAQIAPVSKEKVKTEKKLNSKLFSRAPLKDDEEEFIEVPVEKAEVKEVKKDL